MTLHADEALIARAKEVAAARNTTLDAEFARWLRDFAEPTSRSAALSGALPASECDADSPAREAETPAEAIRRLWQDLSHVNSGRKFTRDEMNERR